MIRRRPAVARRARWLERDDEDWSDEVDNREAGRFEDKPDNDDDCDDDNTRAPSIRLFAGEALEIPALLASPLQGPVAIPPGHGAPVMVLPGYLTSDTSSIRLRASLNAADYRAKGWNVGQNVGLRPGLLERLSGKISRRADRHGQPVALIGWSLGGLFARELAKIVPQDVSLVMTLGSPFSGDPRANNAWRLYEWLNDHRVDDLPIELDLAAKPPVRTIAVWSARDGIVAARAARGLPGERDVACEVRCRHLSLARAPEGIKVIGDLLARHLPR